MSAAKRARTTRSSSSRSATSSFTLQGDESATCAVPEADARKSPTLRALLDEGARSRAVPATLETLERLRDFLRATTAPADLSADQARPAAPPRADPPDPPPAQAAPPWLAPIVELPTMSLLDLCQGASSLGLDALVQAICRKIRTATTASSIKELQEQESTSGTAASRLMGYGPEDVMGNNLVQNFITKEYRALVQAVFDNAGGVETANFEFPLVNVWNQCAIRMTGYTGEDVMGKHLVNEFITDDYKSSILLNATTRRDEHGAVLGVVGIGQDITARALAQEQEYARLIDTANAPIFGIDADGNVNVWNSCASRLMGYGPEDAVFDNALGGVETANFEFPLVTKAGARVEVLLNATPRRDERGAVIGVVGIGQDITARINQERSNSA
ncbi:histidine kinase-like ATPase [Aureococcus anophagefferens]|uniref:histidine kinase n=1 Tax=Aureococcus anophagefferens TaxID=44056 RepID=A0ABR1FQA7_AURAN